MDTRWKNRSKLVGWLLLSAFALQSLMSVVLHGDSVLSRSYFSTSEFQYELKEFLNELMIYELKGIDLERAKTNITVQQHEIQEHRYRYGDLNEQIESIRRQYEPFMRTAAQLNDPEKSKAILQERDSKIEDITANFMSDEHVRSKVVREKEQKLQEEAARLEQRKGAFLQRRQQFQYAFKEMTSGRLVSNLPHANAERLYESLDRRSALFYERYPGERTSYLTTDRYLGYRNEQVEQLLSGPVRAYEGFIAVPASGASPGMIGGKAADFYKKQWMLVFLIVAAGASGAAAVFLYRRWELEGMLRELEQRAEPIYMRLPIDLRAAALLLMGILTFAALANNSYHFLHGPLWARLDDIAGEVIATALLLGLLLLQGRLMKHSTGSFAVIAQQWQDALLSRLWRVVRDAFAIRSIGVSVALALILVHLAGMFGGAAIVSRDDDPIFVYLILLLVVGIPLALLIARRIGYLNRIARYVSELAQGKYMDDLPAKGKSAFAELARDLNRLKQGVTISLSEQAKSERLKTELITNVSHDLRTPLTSIITYTELLKKEGLDEEERKAYTDIIDRKSKRLKTLIDDLFEASKMASGSVELARQNVDLSQLLQQALAEHNDAIEKSGLQFKVSIPTTPLYAFVDGTKLWRVFDNLIGNTLKYSMERTRVYVTLREEDGRPVITFKNVAKYELGDNADELFERFKRGDASRNTEGSGLGLAIAKSIIDLHHGMMRIETEADLFKVTITL